MLKRFIIILLFAVGATGLSAHALESNTSVMQAHLPSSAALIVDMKVKDERPTLEILEVLKQAEGHTLKVGQKLRKEIMYNIGPRYREGVTMLFLQDQGEFAGDKPWIISYGPYAMTPRRRAEYDQDKKLTVLGLSVTSAEISKALVEHVRINPKLAKTFPDADQAKKAKAHAETLGRLALADERLPIWQGWIKGENDLLALDALVGAYEVAEALLPFNYGGGARLVPEATRSALQALVLVGLKADNMWLRSAALALGERVGFPEASAAALLKICKGTPDADLLIVWQEAHRALAAMTNRSAEATKLLWKNLPLKELNQPFGMNQRRRFVNEGFLAMVNGDKKARDKIFEEAKERAQGPMGYQFKAALELLIEMREERSYLVLQGLKERYNFDQLGWEVRYALMGWRNSTWKLGNLPDRMLPRHTKDIVTYLLRWGAQSDPKHLEEAKKDYEYLKRHIRRYPLLSFYPGIIKALSESRKFTARDLPSFYWRCLAMRMNDMTLDAEILRAMVKEANEQEAERIKNAPNAKKKKSWSQKVVPPYERLYKALTQRDEQDLGKAWKTPKETRAIIKGSPIEALLSMAIFGVDEANTKGLVKLFGTLPKDSLLRRECLTTLLTQGKRLEKPIALPDGKTRYEKEILTLLRVQLNGEAAKDVLTPKFVQTLLAGRNEMAIEWITEGEQGKLTLPMMLALFDPEAKFAMTGLMNATYWLNRRSGEWMGFTPDLIMVPEARKVLAKRWTKWLKSLPDKRFDAKSGLFK